jgi:hypothetical protein
MVIKKNYGFSINFANKVFVPQRQAQIKLEHINMIPWGVSGCCFNAYIPINNKAKKKIKGHVIYANLSIFFILTPFMDLDK